MSADTGSYVCGRCRETFQFMDPSEWSDDDDRAEFERLYPGLDFDTEDTDLICHDCFNALQVWLSTSSHPVARQHRDALD